MLRSQNSSSEETKNDVLSTSTPQWIKSVEPVSIKDLRVSDFLTVGDNMHTKVFIVKVIDTRNRNEVTFMKQSGREDDLSSPAPPTRPSTRNGISSAASQTSITDPPSPGQPVKRSVQHPHDPEEIILLLGSAKNHLLSCL